jgi:hypothetical protein
MVPGNANPGVRISTKSPSSPVLGRVDWFGEAVDEHNFQIEFLLRHL